MKLDRYDLKILQILQSQGRISKVRLAEAVGLSTSPTWERLKRLEEAGIITGYHADIDAKKLAPATTVVVEVTLAQHQAADFERFEAAVGAIPEIVECLATGGGVDYVMKVVCANVDAYQRLIDRMLAEDLGIERYFSYVVTKPVKQASGVPLDVLNGGTEA
ncbi:Lrp/AsnC family transcriptional regulator [Rhodobium gokarnense]|uniref:Lrp/AsnC family transcriptional regulator n=1 Tax=Rhodobium gokarnense TaxID=364296 RepID=UPI0022243278|nr:Lrp/AsnC family transcriptional regulator [Rhodobium gokarnense]